MSWREKKEANPTKRNTKEIYRREEEKIRSYGVCRRQSALEETTNIVS